MLDHCAWFMYVYVCMHVGMYVCMVGCTYVCTYVASFPGLIFVVWFVFSIIP